jgi:RimJ/RimL family protein N-acetyltransferase
VFDALASPLVGSFVALEPLAERHVDALRLAASDPRVSEWLPVPLHDPKWFAWWREDARSAWETRRDVTFATVRRADGVAIGSTRFLDSAWYSVLDREWPNVRANLQRRLVARAAEA